MKFSKALEKYLKARDSLNASYRAESGKAEDRATMKECAKVMDELTANLSNRRAANGAAGQKGGA